MYQDKKIAVIIAAAGSGTRMGSGISKQFREISGLPVLVRAVGAFSEHPFIDEIYIVTKEEHREFVLSNIVKKYGLQKVKAVIVGGEQRQDSVYNGINALSQNVDFILVHDGARPFVSSDVITQTIEALLEHKAVAAAVPVKDTIKTCEEGIFTGTPNRDLLFGVQTPQGFHFSVLKNALEKAELDRFYGTDDAVLVERIGQKVYLVEGDYNNIKITTEEDLIFGQAIAERVNKEGEALLEEINNQNKFRVGTGYDVHRLVEGRKLILGGVEIPYEKGLLGHSDADVLLHAIMDALLGAAALGDIGRHFPDNDPEYYGISSLKLLKKVDEAIREKGFSIGNIDATVIAQKPKIASFLQEMRQKIALTLQIELDCINIKGTTTEQLGFCGRGEGIASQASVILYR
ncbi:MAG: 2-C-methyl-D-erythritol 4-phosphate cytidylyltransferase [Anaerovorax sp.]|nr:2-C-methyl-D-erythritol 4-phosphate cytidylyltransferase [Anaerovorax sp.]